MAAKKQIEVKPGQRWTERDTRYPARTLVVVARGHDGSRLMPDKSAPRNRWGHAPHKPVAVPRWRMAAADGRETLIAEHTLRGKWRLTEDVP